MILRSISSISTLLFLKGYDDEEDNIEEEEEEVVENTFAQELQDEVNNHDDHPSVSLRQDDISQYYDIKEEIGK